MLHQLKRVYERRGAVFVTFFVTLASATVGLANLRLLRLTRVMA